MKSVAIIGSGLGGLIAGNLLAKKGHKVTIFESHSMPGGYTAGFYKKGYYFESGTYSFGASASVFKVMKDIGVLEKIDFVKLTTRLITEDFDDAPENYYDYKKMIYAAFPSDKEKLDMAFQELDKVYRITGDISQPIPILSESKEIPGFVNDPDFMKLIMQYSKMSTSEFASRYFEKGSNLYHLFNLSFYPNSTVMMSMRTIVTLLSDFWTVKDGMQSWADVLADNLKQLKGEVRLNSYVEKIVTQNGSAIGVLCNNTFYEADYVISASDYKKTFLKLLDDQSLLPQELTKKIAQAQVSEGFFTVYLGLNMSNEELGKYMKTSHLMNLSKKPGYDIRNSEDAEFFNKISDSIYSPSMINPKHAPEGKSSLMLKALVPYHWMNNWGGGDKKVYARLKEQAMEAIIESASKLIPGLREAIDYKDAATPLTYERFTHNTDGASSTFSWNPKNKFYENGNELSVNIDTPVKNLYIGSAWALQMGGVTGAVLAGHQSAKKIAE